MMRSGPILSVLLLGLVLLNGSPASAQTTPSGLTERPPEWAQRVDLPGLPNLFKVSDELYRGAQPTQEGFAQLQALGIKTVINLRSFHSDRDLLPTGMGYDSIPMNAWHAEGEDLTAFLEIVGDADRGPFFVHCQHGSDRTGLVCAIYRMAVQGWSREDASKEMVEGSFGFWTKWRSIQRFLSTVNIDDLR